MKNRMLADLIRHIHAAQHIALILHVSPDGDTCGSALALRRAFLQLGKDAVAVCDHRTPAIYMELDGAAETKRPDEVADIRFDLAFAIDVADCARMGEAVDVFNGAKQTAQIDHHGTNPCYAEINYLESPLSATGVLALDVIDALGVPLDLEMAKCLYVAVATDTGNFKQQNTDARALEVAARCVSAGLEPHAVTRRVFDLRPMAQIKLMARAFESMEALADGRIVIMKLTRQDFEETGATSEHTEGIVNFGINTEGAQMACLLSVPMEKVRCSLRALPPHNVARVASGLGGGGHMLAAGCTLEPPMEEACRIVREALEEELNRSK